MEWELLCRSGSVFTKIRGNPNVRKLVLCGVNTECVHDPRMIFFSFSVSVYTFFLFFVIYLCYYCYYCSFFFFFCGISVSASMWIRDASPHSTKGWLCYSWLYGLGCHFKLSWLSVHWQSARKWQPSGVTFPIIENNRKQLYLTLRDTTGSRTRLSPSLCGTSLIILDT